MQFRIIVLAAPRNSYSTYVGTLHLHFVVEAKLPEQFASLEFFRPIFLCKVELEVPVLGPVPLRCISSGSIGPGVCT